MPTRDRTATTTHDRKQPNTRGKHDAGARESSEARRADVRRATPTDGQAVRPRASPLARMGDAYLVG